MPRSDALVFQRTLPARQGRIVQLDHPLPGEVSSKLGIDDLWSHQAEAIELARSGRSVVVATGTASGKSLCYQAPIAEAAARLLRPSTSLMVFPTKALAHDQLRSLSCMELPGVTAGAYDGDASREARTWIRRNATVIMTNPEMVHSGLLPNHERWISFLSRLQYVVVDEMHAFRGIFGSQVAHVLRRLRRLAHHYGADPTFVCTSATIGRPARLAEALCGVPFMAVTDDGSPGNERTVSIYNPKAGDMDGHRGAKVPSAHNVTAGVMTELVNEGHRAITFCRSRRATELVAADVQRRLPPAARGRVLPYRGGFLAEQRRAVEDALFAGQLDGVVATSALELGIDVGGLDAVVLNGFPGTVASFWQQAGRAGRTGQPSVVGLVAGNDQLDQWCATHPEELLGRAPEPVVVNPANPSVADAQLRCAARELPLTHADERYWPDVLDDSVRRLVVDDQLLVRPGRARAPQAVYIGGGWPTHDVSLRVGSGGEVAVRSEDGDAIGTVDLGRACEQVHTGATYLHAGQHWAVVDLDLEERVAVVRPHDASTYTVPRTTVELTVLGCEQQRDIQPGMAVGLGWVEVHQQVTGYQIKSAAKGVVLGSETLELPASTLRTRAFWYTIDDALLADAGLDHKAVPGALHAAEHAGIGVLPLFAICDRWDVGGVSTAHQGELGQAAIVIYDGYEGGAGVAELGFEAADRHLATTLEVIEGCGCADGCPSCVQSPKCGNGNEPLDKPGAAALLSHTLAALSAV
jgi:DEAD/DEAH box helicase domain-containing protein